jgi:hypothetical protein
MQSSCHSVSHMVTHKRVAVHDNYQRKPYCIISHTLFNVLGVRTLLLPFCFVLGSTLGSFTQIIIIISLKCSENHTTPHIGIVSVHVCVSTENRGYKPASISW